MEAGQRLATGERDQILRTTGTLSLEEAWHALRPNARKRAVFSIPSRSSDGATPIIRARGLTRRFGDFTAVDDVSFDIEHGEIFGFVGSNGCGKTTTMKMLVGLLAPSAGDAQLNGLPVTTRNREARRDVGDMSQAFPLFGELTVMQNLTLHARVFDLPRDHRERRINELSERFGLRRYLDAFHE